MDDLSTIFVGGNAVTRSSNNNQNHSHHAVAECLPMETLGPALNEQLGGYFIASKDGANFMVLDANSISEALSQGFYVYYVDETLVDSASNSSVVVNVATVDVQSQPFVLTDSSAELLLFDQSASFKSKLISDDGQTVSIIDGLSERHPQVEQQPLSLLSDSVNVEKSATSELAAGRSYDPSGNFQCTVCRLVLKNKKELRQHTKTHEDEKPHTCSECSVAFNHPENLKIHVALSHTTEQMASPYTCPMCNVQLSRYTAFRSHVLLHQIDENLVCHLCHRLFPSRSLLDAHHATEHESDARESKYLTQYRCHLCQRIIFSLGNLSKHYRTQHPNEIRRKRRIPVVVDTTNTIHFTGESSKVSQTTPEHDVRTSKLRAKAYLASLKETSGSRKKTNQSTAYDHMIGIVNSTESVSKETDLSVGKNDSHESDIPVVKPNLRICPICNKRFPKPCLMRRHMLQHTQTKPFECLLCHARFTQKSSARAHMVTHSNATILFCPFCSRQFARKHNLISHMSHAHSDVSVQFVDEPVGVCGQLPVETSHCNALSYSHVVYACPPSTTDASERYFAVPQPLCNVEHSISDPTPYIQLPEPSEVIELDPELPAKRTQQLQASVCHLCQKVFSSSRTLSVHLLRHSTAPLPFSCPQCSRRFACRSHQRYHINTHHIRECKQKARSEWLSRRKSFQNNIGGPLKWNSVLRRFQYTTKKSEGPHQCNQCTKTYRSLYHLRAHIRHQHDTALAPFVCTVCTRRFVTAAALRRHLTRGHQRNVVSRVVCPICELSFANTNSLKRHLVVHSNERPYRCAWCKKAFKFHSSCSKHMKARVCQSRVVSIETANALASGFTQDNFDVFPANYNDDLVAHVHCSESDRQFQPSSSTVLLPNSNNLWRNSIDTVADHHSSSNKNEQVDLTTNRFGPALNCSYQNNSRNDHLGDLVSTGNYADAAFIPTRNPPFYPFATSSSPSTGEKLHLDSASNTAPQFSASIDWANEPILVDSDTAINTRDFQTESYSTVTQAPTTLQPHTMSLNHVYSCANTLILTEPTGTHGYTNLLMDSEYPRDSVQILGSLDSEMTPWSYVTTADRAPSVMTNGSRYRQLTELTNLTNAPPLDKTCANFIHDPIIDRTLGQVIHENDHSHHLVTEQPELDPQYQLNAEPPQPPASLTHETVVVHSTMVQSSKLNLGETMVYGSHREETTNPLSPTVESKPAFGCALCSASFMNAEDLLAHNRAAHPFQEQSHVVCQLCDMSFSSETLFLAHCQSHTKRASRSFICPVCPTAVFSSKSGLTRHINFCHPAPNSDRFQCRYCGTKFAHLRALRSHLASRNQCAHDVNKAAGGSRTVGQQSMKPRRHYRGVRLPALKTTDLHSWARLEPSDEMMLSEKYLIKAAAEFLNESDQTSANQPDFSSSEGPLESTQVQKTEAADSQYKRHICSVCAKPFRLASDLKRHMCRHTGDRPFKCAQCDKQYIKHYQLRQHQLKAHNTSSSVPHEATTISSAQSSSSCRTQFTCHICHRMYRGKFNLLRHVRLHATHRRFTCPHCHRKFTTLSRKRSHVSKCSTEQDRVDFPTCIDSAVIGTTDSLPMDREPSFLEQLHNDSVDEGLHTSVTLDHTHDTTVTVVDLDEVLPYHDAKAAVNVDEPVLGNCDFPLSSQPTVWDGDAMSLSLPEVAEFLPSGTTHSSKNTINATANKPDTSICNIVAASSAGDGQHRWHGVYSVATLSDQISLPPAKKIQFIELTRCETCQKEFSDRASYRKHDCYLNPGTTNGKRYLALDNSQQSSMIDRHITNSNQAKRSARNKRVPASTSCVLQTMHQCEHCDRIFNHITSLKRHKATHAREKPPFPCETCGVTFTKRSSLASHKLIHQGVKPYRCSRCAMRFRQQSNLRRHMKALHS